MSIDKASDIYFSIQDEETVLKYLMSCPDSLYEVFKNLSEKDFFYNDTKQIFLVIKYLYNAGLSLSHTNVLSYIERKDSLDDCIIESLNKISLKNINYKEMYAVIQRIKCAAVITDFKKGVSSVFNSEKLEHNAEIYTNLLEINNKFLDSVKNNLTSAYEVHDSYSDGLKLKEIVKENMGSGSKLSEGGIPSGFSFLDEYTGGLAKETLIILGGDLNEGKTTMAINIAAKMTKLGKKILYISLEMSAMALRKKIASIDLDLPTRHFTKAGTFNPQNFESLSYYVESLKTQSFLIIDKRGLSLKDIEHAIIEQKRIYDIDVVFIDHIQIIRKTDFRQTNNDFLADVSKLLRDFSSNHNVCVIALSQLNRRPKEERNIPTVDNIRDSHTIGQNADTILLLYIPEEENSEENGFSDFSNNNKRAYRKKIGFINMVIAKDREDTNKNKIINFKFKDDTSLLMEIGEGRK